MQDYEHDTPDQLFDFRVPIGGIVLFPGAIYEGTNEFGEPKLKDSLRLAGWMEAKGQELDKKEYAALFATIDYRYNVGDEPQDTFRLPDMRGMFVRGTQNTERDNPEREQFDDPDAVAGRRLRYSDLTPESSTDGVELVGSLEMEEVLEHTHSIDDLGQALGGDKPPANGVFAATGSSRESGKFGGVETRPTNIAVYYLLKVKQSRWMTSP